MTESTFRPKPPRATGAYCAPGASVCGATPAAASGPAHVEEPVAYDALLLLGFGGPEGQEDVIPFLRNVTAGRGIPDERLEEVAHHYRHFGGVSPINAQNRALVAALEAELARRDIDLPVYWGNRNWMPYVADAVQQLHADGHRRVLALATSAYSSYSSCRQYREDLADALEATGLGEQLQIDKVGQFFDHPGFVDSFVDGIRDGLGHLRAQGIEDASDIEILFSTPSPSPTPTAPAPGTVTSERAARTPRSTPPSPRRSCADSASTVRGSWSIRAGRDRPRCRGSNPTSTMRSASCPRRADGPCSSCPSGS